MDNRKKKQYREEWSCGRWCLVPRQTETAHSLRIRWKGEQPSSSELVKVRRVFDDLNQEPFDYTQQFFADDASRPLGPYPPRRAKRYVSRCRDGGIGLDEEQKTVEMYWIIDRDEIDDEPDPAMHAAGFDDQSEEREAVSFALGLGLPIVEWDEVWAEANAPRKLREVEDQPPAWLEVNGATWKAFNQAYSSRGSREVSVGYAGVNVFDPAEALDEQVGFAVDGDGGILASTEPGNWQSTWFVIGHDSGLADPYFVDISDPAWPVFTVAHDGDWIPKPIAPSFDVFHEALDVLADHAKKRGNPVALEKNPPSQGELARLESRLKELKVDPESTGWLEWFAVEDDEDLY